MTETKKPAAKYIYELADGSGAARYVEARTKEQAIAHVFKPTVKTLSARDAVTIARNPNIVVEIAGEAKLDQPELPLASGAQDPAGTPQAESSTDNVLTQAADPIVDQSAAQADPEPSAAGKKKGLFGRSAA